MKSTHSVIVTVIPRRMKHHSQKLKKVRPIAFVQDSFQLPSSSSNLCITSTPYSTRSKTPLMITDNTKSFKNGRIQDLRGGTKKKLKSLPKLSIVLLIVVSIFLFLSGLSVGIYFLIRPTSKTVRYPGNAILRWNTSGITVAGISGLLGNSSSHLNQPIDVVVPSVSTLYVLDYQNNRLQKWSIGQSSGQTVAGYLNGSGMNSSTTLKGPIGFALDSNENIYIVDTGNNRVQFFTKGSRVGTTVAGNGTAGSANHLLSNPCGISLDSQTNRFYIADSNNRRIISYIKGVNMGTEVARGNTSGPTTTFLLQPLRVHFDSISNSLLIVERARNSIIRWLLGANQWSLVAGHINGTSGVSSNELNVPMSVTLDPMGNVYVADSFNHRIQFFESGRSDGRTIAGVTGMGSTNASHLYYPYSVVLDSQLNFFVTDTANHRVQKFQRY